MKTYKLRFVQLSMLLVGSVLFCILIIVYGFSYSERLDGLEITMHEMLEPLSLQDPDMLPDDAEKSRFVTVFVGATGTDDLAVFSLSADYDEDTLSDIVDGILQANSDFGYLKEHRMYFCRRGMSTGYKITMVESTYITRSMNNLLILLIGSWVAAMVVFCVVSCMFANIAVKPIEQAREREAQFIADISHDLKTPLSVIMANNDIILNDDDSDRETYTKWITGSQEAAVSMRSMIHQMLDLYVTDSVDFQVKPEIFDLGEAAERAVLQMEALAWEQDVQLDDGTMEAVDVFADQQLVSRIMNILIDNALKYENKGGCVSVSVCREQKDAVFTISNHAVISQDDLPHIFERFYRADKSRSHGGHGLGLAIAQSLAQRTGGKLSCVSSENTGTAFTLRYRSRKSIHLSDLRK